jgi:hypothetical protein
MWQSPVRDGKRDNNRDPHDRHDDASRYDRENKMLLLFASLPRMKTSECGGSP